MTTQATKQARNFPFELPDSISISIIDRRKSNYRIDGDGETGEGGTEVDTSTGRRIKPISNVMVFNETLKKWEVKQIRYLQGCPTIWVDEQKELGYKSNNPGLDNVWIDHGALAFTVDGYNIQKAEFIMLHENNVSFIGDEQYKRPDGAVDVFEQLNTKQTAEQDVFEFDFEAEGIEYLKKLKTGSGKQSVYNEDVIEFLCKLFKFPNYESNAEKFIALRAQLSNDPKGFMSKIGNYESLVQADVKRALDSGVIIMDDVAASFAVDNNVFLTFSRVRMSKSEMFKEVLDFMLNPNNSKEYNRMRVLSTGALNKSANIITE